MTLFTRQGCHLCDAAREIIERVRSRLPFEFELVDIDEPAHEQWLDAYDTHVPVVHIDARELARHRLEEDSFEAALKEPQV